MGDHRAGSSGPTATVVNPSPIPTPAPGQGRRIARHAAEQRTSQPYVGRRVAPAIKAPVRSAESLTYPGRRVAGRNPVSPVAPPIAPPADDLDDVSAHLLLPPATPTLEPYAGRRLARDLPLIVEPAVLVPELAPPVVEPTLVEAIAPQIEIPVADPTLVIAAPVEEPTRVIAAPVVTAPVIAAPVIAAPVVAAPVITAPVIAAPVEASAPVVESPTTTKTAKPPTKPPTKQGRPTGRRVASRRIRVPSLPLLSGVAVLAISTCGALQAMHPDLGGADADGHLSPASALSGSSAVGSASLLGGRDGVVSRSSDRRASSAGGTTLRAAADAQAQQRDQVLSAIRGQAEKRAAQIKLHAWVLPVASGVYHLTARFGDYSSLWAHFHTGLDFAAPTGTPIMAVAGGTITEVGYSGAYGNRTIERLADGTELWYCHQNEFGTSVGATVKPGQVIGYVGSTGNVTGPHLHLEVHPGGGDPVDPYAALVAHGLYPGPPA